MNDKELLELAANAAGYTGHWDDAWYKMSNGRTGWNPLTDDGDALRLAVKLNLTIRICELQKDTIVESQKIIGCQIIENHGNYSCAATRRAIVRAAAEIGKTMGNLPDAHS